MCPAGSTVLESGLLNLVLDIGQKSSMAVSQNRAIAGLLSRPFNHEVYACTSDTGGQ